MVIGGEHYGFMDWVIELLSDWLHAMSLDTRRGGMYQTDKNNDGTERICFTALQLEGYLGIGPYNHASERASAPFVVALHLMESSPQCCNLTASRSKAIYQSPEIRIVYNFAR